MPKGIGYPKGTKKGTKTATKPPVKKVTKTGTKKKQYLLIVYIVGNNTIYIYMLL